MEAIARVRNLRGSARKARLVLDLIRGKNIYEAKKILTFSNKRVALNVEKLLDSAIANVSDKEGKTELNGYLVSKAFADDGPIMRRFMPRAMGRATIIRKRTCHITLAISPQDKEA
jgi:large subunit ribosomal protein L22